VWCVWLLGVAVLLFRAPVSMTTPMTATP
jgi:hypothetical protein